MVGNVDQMAKWRLKTNTKIIIAQIRQHCEYVFKAREKKHPMFAEVLTNLFWMKYKQDCFHNSTNFGK